MDKAYSEMGITAQMSDIQKLAAIQNWISSHWRYSQADFQDDAIEGYLLVKYGYGACGQFAHNFNYFANKAGIESYSIGGMRKKLQVVIIGISFVLKVNGLIMIVNPER